ncbi:MULTISPECIES: FmdB family zinc ribbon protein [unclassified Arthrobacter]|uniref:FmdB family zinc ribbon protein n=1 Tax=unclassified Arthrobacter TaxID=235627 RepID=UPI001D132DCC|nr:MULTISPECIES: zinc ribbon domain-containing protein [unclassified Arthrobacter]MCC3275959.1 zinc ribbon domain-containing protein [Arthrobacter sp. zg-Y20]MCC9176456.1 zinc ribbon domain-containing protein [Arthrobacter sp. zg-Y750]MDK1316116.1 zinc ribbon domain-containing protein [Arthrobacter sp. zg.Y20]WIB05595.1 zinc ribbon domain-containing protein [Arthrobacter sp. zg-Y20]
MPLYSYRCPDCREFDVFLAMGEATGFIPCPICGHAAQRRFTGPHLSHASGSAYRLLEKTERSASEPGVVAVPGTEAAAPRATTSANPLHRKLPRPD